MLQQNMKFWALSSLYLMANGLTGVDISLFVHIDNKNKDILL